MSTRQTLLLDKIYTPVQLRQLSASKLPALANALRFDIIKAVSQTGGHLGAGLGVFELTIALHYIFDTPNDKLIWDVGHQAYPHKILTGRREQMSGLRQEGSLSGFTKRSESLHDPFGAGNFSTSISAGLGMVVARDLQGGTNNVIAVLGDGAMNAGMAFEALNNAGAMNSNLIVILNDNDMSISPPVRAMSAYLRLPDEYFDHAEPSSQMVSAGLDVDSLFAVAGQLVSDKLDSSEAKHFKNLGNK